MYKDNILKCLLGDKSQSIKIYLYLRVKYLKYLKNLRH